MARSFIDNDVAAIVWPKAPPPGILLVDGTVVGTWRRRGRAVTLSPFRDLQASEVEQATSIVEAFPLPGDEPASLSVERGR